MLIHANQCWPGAVTVHLWPYTLHKANHALNCTPNSKLPGGQTPEEAFSQTRVAPNLKHAKPFGCPVYVLDNQLQQNSAIFHKWKDQARVGLYLGRSPFHARLVALVLNLQTGFVSPQFHVKFNPSFQTMCQAFIKKPPESLWQVKCGFAIWKGSTP